MFALDTNTLIYFFRGTGRVKDHLLALSPAEIAIPAIVLYELETGTGQAEHASKRRGQLDELVRVVSVLPFDTAAAKRAAEVSLALRKTGTAIGPMDGLIAGTVLVHNATLVTRNSRDFRRVRGLDVVDWY